MEDISEQFCRTELLLGSEALQRLRGARVLVFGVGGVGGFACEALARAGVGGLDIVDSDVVAKSNINRQIIALHSTVGLPKVSVLEKRLLDINPSLSVTARQVFFLPETACDFDFSAYDYVVDAVDTVAAKIEIIRLAKEAGVSVISSMGAGNKLDPTLFRVADIAQTSVCPLARAVRRELKKRGICGVKVVFSTEKPVTRPGAAFPASISFVPSVAGLIIAGEVVRDLAAKAQFKSCSGGKGTKKGKDDFLPNAKDGNLRAVQKAVFDGGGSLLPEANKKDGFAGGDLS